MIEKVSVVHATNRLGLGGTEKVLQLLAAHLDKRFFCVSVCGIQGGGERADLLRRAGYEVGILNSDMGCAVRFLREKKPDILHWHSAGSPEPFILRAAKEAGVGAVVRTNVFGQHDASEEAKSVNANIFVSKSCFLRYVRCHRENIRDFYAANKVIYNPIELSIIEEAKLTPERAYALRDQYRIGEHDPLIGRVGRPDDSKFGSICIDMMPHLLKTQPRVKFIVVGITAQKRRLIRALGLEKHFVVIEPTADSRALYELYRLLDVYAHSATWGESFGCGIAEAMACKKPVVTHATPHWDNAQVELVDHGKTGLVANFPRLYAGAVDFLLQNRQKAQEMGWAGYEKAGRHYDICVVARQTEGVYLDVLSRKGALLSGDMLRYSEKAVLPCVSLRELEDFRREYDERLRRSFGAPNITESAAYCFDEAAIYAKSFVRRLLKHG